MRLNTFSYRYIGRHIVQYDGVVVDSFSHSEIHVIGLMDLQDHDLEIPYMSGGFTDCHLF